MKVVSNKAQHKPPVPLFEWAKRHHITPLIKIRRWQIDGNLRVTRIEVAMAKIKATFRIGVGPPTTATVCEAQTITAMFAAWPKGLTSLDTHHVGWALRFEAYIFDLRKMGVPILTGRERHTSGSHGRYFLMGPVHLIKLIDSTKMAVAA